MSKYSYKNLKNPYQDPTYANYTDEEKADLEMSDWENWNSFENQIDNATFDAIELVPMSAKWKAEQYIAQLNSAKEWQANYEMMLADQEYNSEESKVERMRAAGLNPDIQGIEGASETQSKGAPSINSPAGTPDNTIQTVGSVIGLFNSIIGTAISAGGQKLQNQSTRIDNLNKAASGIAGAFGNQLTQDEIKVLSKKPADMTPEEVAMQSDIIDRFNTVQRQYFQEYGFHKNNGYILGPGAFNAGIAGATQRLALQGEDRASILDTTGEYGVGYEYFDVMQILADFDIKYQEIMAKVDSISANTSLQYAGIENELGPGAMRQQYATDDAVNKNTEDAAITEKKQRAIDRLVGETMERLEKNGGKLATAGALTIKALGSSAGGTLLKSVANYATGRGLMKAGAEIRAARRARRFARAASR